jgi:hypothetical protein
MKIFGIGYPRTGTTSLTNALLISGYDAYHDRYELFPRAYISGDLTSAMDFDASTNIYQTMFMDFDEQYPDSKFILTTRRQKGWLKSIYRHKRRDMHDLESVETFYDHLDTLNVASSKMSVAIYIELFGCVGYNELLFAHRYNEHNLAVMNYFGDRCLILDLEDVDKVGKLAEFLGTERIKSWPHSNRG